MLILHHAFDNFAGRKQCLRCATPQPSSLYVCFGSSLIFRSRMPPFRPPPSHLREFFAHALSRKHFDNKKPATINTLLMPAFRLALQRRDIILHTCYSASGFCPDLPFSIMTDFGPRAERAFQQMDIIWEDRGGGAVGGAARLSSSWSDFRAEICLLPAYRL